MSPPPRPSLLDHPVISGRYFFPRRDAPHEVCSLEAADGSTLACAWHRVPGSPVTLVHFHGNGETVADYWPAWPRLWGLDTLLVEYRGYGASTGEPSLAAMLDDVHAVAAACDKPMLVFGRSVGSIYALHLAAEHPVAGLILESGIADPLERVLLRVHPSELGATREALAAAARERLDHRAKMARVEAPVLVLHAAGDDLVPPSHGERLAAWARDAELLLLPGGDHNTIFWANEAAYVAAVRGFIARCSA